MQINSEPAIIKHLLKKNAQFPNSNLFLLIYKNAVDPQEVSASLLEEIFKKNNWKNSWRNGIYDYAHYHSNSHEVLGIYSGDATVQFGGKSGITESIGKGDIIIIPAGVAHQCINSSADFKCVGAYPDGKDYDIKKEDDDILSSEENIKNVPLPDTDPVYGEGGFIKLEWEVW